MIYPGFDRPLRGWKEISSFMSCSITTAKRRRKYGLPVKYEPGSTKPVMVPMDYVHWVHKYGRKL